ncbi:hypothetical protein ACLF3G_27265 [Falsiroseomonas sp. HC035]|uniref:hypothetical protein n=1 Tax=Falsiroseomonas sp. HC035 TaxID=3390999 RepID=UPI003D318A97
MTTPDVAVRLGLTAEQVEALTTVSSGAGEPPEVLVTIEEVARRLVQAVLEFDDGLRRRELGGVGDGLLPGHHAAEAADRAAEGWSDGLDLDADEVVAFERVVAAMGLTAITAIRAMLAPVVKRGRMMGWSKDSEERLETIAFVAVRVLPMSIMPTGMMWPIAEPFPWSEREALAVVLGYEVRWTGSRDQFLTKLRGRWEMSNGRAVLWQS